MLELNNKTISELEDLHEKCRKHELKILSEIHHRKKELLAEEVRLKYEGKYFLAKRSDGYADLRANKLYIYVKEVISNEYFIGTIIWHKHLNYTNIELDITTKFSNFKNFIEITKDEYMNYFNKIILESGINNDKQQWNHNLNLYMN